MPVPDGSPMTRELVIQGRRLFHDKRLSRDKSVACSSCHEPSHAFSSTTAIASGAFGRRGQRNPPALLNRGYGRTFFWDGRAGSLEEQVLQPIQSPTEMDMTLPEVTARVGLDERHDRARTRRLRPQRAIRELALRSLRRRRRAARSARSRRPACRSFAARATARRATSARPSPTSGSTTPVSPGATAGSPTRAGRRDVERRGSRRLQDADAARGRAHRALHARRQPPDARRPSSTSTIRADGRIRTSTRRCGRGGSRRRIGSRSSRSCGRCRARCVRGGSSCRHAIFGAALEKDSNADRILSGPWQKSA